MIFEIDQDKAGKDYKFDFKFTTEGFYDLLRYIETIANQSWNNLNPREADSLGTDYYEYYDRDLDNNGYLGVGRNELLIERPSLESGRLYQFNKRKMESFLYDFRKVAS